ncbi:MAG: DUF488 domain-containing protein [Planctomycetes bacterium]|nr:DUF488 domain-containing protein [Planctomycetota bacterium]
MATSPALFTIGHSTHPIERFIALLQQHGVAALIDVRRFPGSRRQPQFHQAALAEALTGVGMEYHWIEALGGRRSSGASSPENAGLRNKSFQNYADYMQTAEFRAGVESALEIATRLPSAIMCAEGLFWRCHRRLIADYLLARGITAQHIMPNGAIQPHSLTEGGRLSGAQVTYPKPAEQQSTLFE